MSDIPSESSFPDTEDWEIVLEPYFAHPEAALGLARHFAAIREFLKASPPDVLRAIDALDLGVESLYTHSQFQTGSYELYETTIEGRATTAQEALARSLGVKI
jgi:hypothetical protein